MSNTKGVTIGVDPHKMSATIEFVESHEQMLRTGRFDTDKAGYAAMQRYVRRPDRVWAVEGANGAGRPLAQRMVAGEHVLRCAAKLSARVRLFDTGHNRMTDALDAHATSPERPAAGWLPKRSSTWSRSTRS